MAAAARTVLSTAGITAEIQELSDSTAAQAGAACALFAWEGLALAQVSGVPSLSDVVRVIMRYPAGRWALFALWLWAGWQLFIHRWPGHAGTA